MGEEVKVHGLWPSPFVCRVIWALKMKGIEYEYIEEEFPISKSSSVVKYNSVHKKVPVLVHNGKAISESMVIVEYIDETWPQNPLMPIDPYERATARFWVKFHEDKAAALSKIMRTTGEEQENSKKECMEVLQIIEEQALGDKKFFGGETIGFLDISFGLIAHWLGIIGEAVGIDNLLDAEKFPRLSSWATRFNEDPVIKENLQDSEKLLAFFKKRREMALASA